MSEFRDMATVELMPADEVFVTDVKAENFRPFNRLTFAASERAANYPGEPPQLLVVAKLIVPPANPVTVKAGMRGGFLAEVRLDTKTRNDAQ
jgi:hypothetical protein